MERSLRSVHVSSWIHHHLRPHPPYLHGVLSPSLSTSTVDSNGSTSALGPGEAPRIRMVPCIDITRNPGMRIDVIEREIRPGSILELGRFSDELFIPNRISFRNKVISRHHAVIWTEGSKFYIRDTKSSSGTFLNNERLSFANKESREFRLKDGDILQLGVNYRGGTQDIYRCIKFRLEINRKRTHQVDVFGFQAYQTLRKLTSSPSEKEEENAVEDDTRSEPDCEVKECCICLYAVAPFQALFVAPCQHIFHYKCTRGLLGHYPGFQCPLCRSYADLETSVAVETSEVRKMLRKLKSNDTCPIEDNISSSSRV
ncbi:SMAD/FHA domain-containing protein [Fennellomyces sp. T-0311]|nr:SMAD/FHA domain-containing protein [Fennellomyces sp. T-0311]